MSPRQSSPYGALAYRAAAPEGRDRDAYGPLPEGFRLDKGLQWERTRGNTHRTILCSLPVRAYQILSGQRCTTKKELDAFYKDAMKAK